MRYCNSEVRYTILPGRWALNDAPRCACTQVCRAYGGNLAWFSTPAEYAAVDAHYAPVLALYDEKKYWLGLSDRGSEGWYFWLNDYTTPDTTSAFNYWSPAHLAADGQGLNCVAADQTLTAGGWAGRRRAGRRVCVGVCAGGV